MARAIKKNVCTFQFIHFQYMCKIKWLPSVEWVADRFTGCRDARLETSSIHFRYSFQIQSSDLPVEFRLSVFTVHYAEYDTRRRCFSLEMWYLWPFIDRNKIIALNIKQLASVRLGDTFSRHSVAGTRRSSDPCNKIINNVNVSRRFPHENCTPDNSDRLRLVF